MISLAPAMRLGPRDWVDTLVALVAVVVTEVGLRVTTLPRLARAVGSPLDTGPQSAPPPGRGSLRDRDRRRLAAARRVSRHWPFGDSCLRVSLVSGYMVRDLHPVLRVGVTKLDGGVKAHAWLEIGGRSLDVAGAAQYLTLTTADAS